MRDLLITEDTDVGELAFPAATDRASFSPIRDEGGPVHRQLHRREKDPANVKESRRHND
jgi:hypothetical protein